MTNSITILSTNFANKEKFNLIYYLFIALNQKL